MQVFVGNPGACPLASSVGDHLSPPFVCWFFPSCKFVEKVGVGEGVGRLFWSAGLNIVSAMVQVSLFSITMPRCVCASCHLECFTVCVMAEGKQLTEMLLRFCTVLQFPVREIIVG